MTGYLIRRFITSIVIMLGVAIFIFLSFRGLETNDSEQY